MKATCDKLAEDHWEWLGGLLKKVYCDAFVHGYKHGVDDTKDDGGYNGPG